MEAEKQSYHFDLVAADGSNVLAILLPTKYEKVLGLVLGELVS